MLTLLIGSTDKATEDGLRVMGKLATVASIDSVSAALNGTKPDVILLDLRDKQGIPPALASVRRSYPSTGIIVLADRLDPTSMLEAMRAGANEILAAPVREADLRRAIERVTSLLNPMREKGKLLVFLGAKGGVGTTTLAVNVATALSQLPQARVLLIDLHSAYGDAALFLGTEARFSVLDALENIHRLDGEYFKSLVVHTMAGPHLLASSDRSSTVLVDAQRVLALLEFVVERYTHIVVDVSRSDAALLDALESISALVIVANQELATVRTAGLMASRLRLRFGKERLQVVIDRHDAASEIGQADIERATGGPIQFIFPSDYRLAVSAMNKGRPFVTDNHAELATSISLFAQSLLCVHGKRRQPDPSPAVSKSRGLLSLFGRH